MKTSILITGVAGLLGSRLADYILDKYPETKVIGIDNLSGGFRSNIDKRIIFYETDLIEDKLEEIFSFHKIEYVFHFAAYAAEGLSPFIRTYNYSNNVIATAKIVNECIKHNVKRLVFTSSMAVYGHGWEGKRPFEEGDIPKPIDPYGIAKYACEMDIQVAGEQHGLDWCIIRPHNVYGVKQNIWDKYRNVLGIWMYQYLNDQPMTIFGDGSQTRAFSCIDDCLEPLFKAATIKEASKEIINLGGTQFTTINEANAIFRDIIRNGNVEHKEARHEVKDAYPTWAKSQEILGYKHTTSLYDGLLKMWEWAQKQPMRERFFWENYEIEKGIYSYWKDEPSIRK
jgi:UDP-glucose 4-epimerase